MNEAVSLNESGKMKNYITTCLYVCVCVRVRVCVSCKRRDGILYKHTADWSLYDSFQPITKSDPVLVLIKASKQLYK